MPRSHRTLGDGVATVVGAGLALGALGEPCPDVEAMRAAPPAADAAVAPPSLHLRARTPAALPPKPPPL